MTKNNEILRLIIEAMSLATNQSVSFTEWKRYVMAMAVVKNHEPIKDDWMLEESYKAGTSVFDFFDPETDL